VILGDADIRAAMERKDIIIAPYKRGNLGPVSYDVSLGEFYYQEQKPNDPLGASDWLNPYVKEDIDRVWGQPVRAGEVVGEKFPGFHVGERVILLEPGETILAHTEEFIGGRNNITTRMQARSSWGRLGVGVCKCAGKGDPGYVNRWTMEITSFNQYHTVMMKVGERVAQIEFMYVAHTANQYEDKGNYQEHSPDDMEEVFNSWTPEMMLPKLYRQKEHGGEATGTSEGTTAG